MSDGLEEMIKVVKETLEKEEPLEVKAPMVTIQNNKGAKRLVHAESAERIMEKHPTVWFEVEENVSLEEQVAQAKAESTRPYHGKPAKKKVKKKKVSTKKAD